MDVGSPLQLAFFLLCLGGGVPPRTHIDPHSATIPGRGGPQRRPGLVGSCTWWPRRPGALPSFPSISGRGRGLRRVGGMAVGVRTRGDSAWPAYVLAGPPLPSDAFPKKVRECRRLGTL